MSDDKEPQGPFNPFIRFKNHVNARIGTGVSVITGTSQDRDKPAGDAQNGSADTARPLSCPARRQSPGTLKQQLAMIDYWDDWCHVDPYSPHNLHHLRQPTPKDLPPGADPADFGFPEAFEDLMTASSPFGGHLMELGKRARPVKPETPSAWVRRLYGDALLPPPFIWEQPRLGGGLTGPFAAPPRGPFESTNRAEHDHYPDGDIASAFLETIRRMESIAGESFSKMEELMGRDVAEALRKAQKFAEKTMEVFSDERPGDHNSVSSTAKTQGDARHASASEEDQPATEQDLYEMFQSASAEVDKFLNDWVNIRARQAPPPAERPTREDPPVSATVEHDPFGGKTIRTCSEHVDMFGFVHSKTEVRRLNAKGQMVDYDTRYSVRSAPRGVRPPQQEYRPRSDAPVSALMTPEQYSAFIGRSSDEQLEAFRVSTAEANESSLDPENLALKNQQMRLILQEQQRRADVRDARADNPRLQDYQRQLILLQEQNKRRLEMSKNETASSGKTAPGGEEHNPQRYQEGLERLEEQGRERVKKAKEEQAAARPPPEKPQGGTNTERSGWFWR